MKTTRQLIEYLVLPLWCVRSHFRKADIIP